jgi:hypothetical protein
MLKDRLSLIAAKKRNGQPVVYKLIHKSRKITVERPQYAAVHQLPTEKTENSLGNFWIIQESTPGRFLMGRNEATIYFQDLPSAKGVLKYIVDHDLDVPTKTPKGKMPQFVEDLEPEVASEPPVSTIDTSYYKLI